VCIVQKRGKTDLSGYKAQKGVKLVYLGIKHKKGLILTFGLKSNQKSINRL
jgi:hypothetical protein